MGNFVMSEKIKQLQTNKDMIFDILIQYNHHEEAQFTRVYQCLKLLYPKANINGEVVTKGKSFEVIAFKNDKIPTQIFSRNMDGTFCNEASQLKFMYALKGYAEK